MPFQASQSSNTNPGGLRLPESEVEESDDDPWEYMDLEVSPAEVIYLLRPVRETLLSLSLDFRKGFFFSRPEAGIKTLRGFHGARELGDRLRVVADRPAAFACRACGSDG